MSNPQMKLSAFLMADGNYHLAAWRQPDACADAGHMIGRWVEFARTLERGLFDMLFIADNISPVGVDYPDVMSQTARTTGFEPLTLLSALSVATTHIGLAATASTTWNQPYTLARMFASLDHLSGGRAGWNLVTGRNAEDALNFSASDHLAYADRYARAEEFADVVRGLWDSFDDDAFTRDKQSGVFFEKEKMHLLNHEGRNFRVRGPLSVERPPQGHPVIIQAGESEPARELSARVADAVFTAQSSFEAGRAFYADVKGRLAKFGREADDLKILPGVTVYVGRTEAEAEEKYQRLNDSIPVAYALRQLSLYLGGIDLSDYDLDGPMPQIKGNVTRANPDHWLTFARDNNLTLRQTAIRASGSKGHWVIKSTPSGIVDELEHWFRNGAADGFNLLPPVVPTSLNEFVDLVVPELQRRGLYRRSYEGRTLREHLGLARPGNLSSRTDVRRNAAE